MAGGVNVAACCVYGVRIGDAVPLVDGMVVSRRVLGHLVRQTAVNIFKRRQLDIELYVISYITTHLSHSLIIVTSPFPLLVSVNLMTLLHTAVAVDLKISCFIVVPPPVHYVGLEALCFWVVHFSVRPCASMPKWRHCPTSLLSTSSQLW